VEDGPDMELGGPWLGVGGLGGLFEAKTGFTRKKKPALRGPSAAEGGGGGARRRFLLWWWVSGKVGEFEINGERFGDAV